MSLQKAKTVAEIAKLVIDSACAIAERIEKRRADDKDRRIKELEAEVERLKARP